MFRSELKYQTSRSKADNIFCELSTIFKPDINSGISNSYENASIYFDDKSFSSYREKHEGYNVRSKIRLRLSRPLGTQNFTRHQVEIKERIGVDTAKRAFSIDEKDVPELIQNISFFMAQKHNVYFDDHLFPVVGVKYNRVATYSEVLPGLRITYDTDIKCFYDFSSMIHEVPNPLILQPDKCLIEFKTTREIPETITAIFEKHGLQRITFSKYAKSLEKMYEFIRV